jgi:hypothetical protein
MHNATFHVDSPKSNRLSPRRLFFIEDHRSIVFLSSETELTKNIVYLYNIENSVILDEHVLICQLRASPLTKNHKPC